MREGLYGVDKMITLKSLGKDRQYHVEHPAPNPAKLILLAEAKCNEWIDKSTMYCGTIANLRNRHDNTPATGRFVVFLGDSSDEEFFSGTRKMMMLIFLRW